MHGDEAELFMSCTAVSIGCRYAQSPAGQVEQWWPDTRPLCPTSSPFSNLNVCGGIEVGEEFLAPPKAVTCVTYY